MIEILNHYYGYNYVSDLGLREKVFNQIKTDKPEIYNIFESIKNDEIYKAAHEYRNEAAHGTSVGEIHNFISVKQNISNEVPDEQSNLIGKKGKVKTKKAQAEMVISYGVGEYTKARVIITNIEEYSKLTGEKIQEIIGKMLAN